MTGLHGLNWGVQADVFGGARVWLLPNPSGVNRAFTLNRLVDHYSRLRLDLAGEIERFVLR